MCKHIYLVFLDNCYKVSIGSELPVWPWFLSLIFQYINVDIFHIEKEVRVSPLATVKMLWYLHLMIRKPLFHFLRKNKVSIIFRPFLQLLMVVIEHVWHFICISLFTPHNNHVI